MADGTTTMLASRKWSMPRLGSKVHVSIGYCSVCLERENVSVSICFLSVCKTEERIETRLNYRILLSDLQSECTGSSFVVLCAAGTRDRRQVDLCIHSAVTSV